jgi:hypothetical protein
MKKSISQNQNFVCNIVISLVKYWYRLVNLSNESKLLRDAYICNKNVANEGKQSWFLFTEKLLKFTTQKNYFSLYTNFLHIFHVTVFFTSFCKFVKFKKSKFILNTNKL